MVGKLGTFRKAVEQLVDIDDPAQIALAIIAIDSYEGKDKMIPLGTKEGVEIVEWLETDLKLAADCVHKITKHQTEKAKLSSGNASNHTFTTVFVVDGANDGGVVDPWDVHPMNPNRLNKDGEE